MSFYKEVSSFFKPNIKDSIEIENLYYTKEIINYKNNLLLQSVIFFINHLDYDNSISINDFFIHEDFFIYDKKEKTLTMKIKGDKQIEYISFNILLDENIDNELYLDKYKYKLHLEKNIKTYLNVIKKEIIAQTNFLNKEYKNLIDKIKKKSTFKNPLIDKYNGLKFSFFEEKNKFILNFYIKTNYFYMEIRNNKEKKNVVLIHDNFFNHYMSNFNSFYSYELNFLDKEINAIINDYFYNYIDLYVINQFSKILKDKNLNNFILKIDRNLEDDYKISYDKYKDQDIIFFNYFSDINFIIHSLKNVRLYREEEFTHLKDKKYDLNKNLIDYNSSHIDILTFKKYKKSYLNNVERLIKNPNKVDIDKIVNLDLNYLNKSIYKSLNYNFKLNDNTYSLYVIRIKNMKNIKLAFKNDSLISIKEIKKEKRKYKRIINIKN